MTAKTVFTQAWRWPLAGPLRRSLGPGRLRRGSSGMPAPMGPGQQSGYITLPDGSRMRYSLLLPEGQGPFPLLVEYDGYISGSYPNISSPWTKEGYAVMGLNVPGTGCSTGKTGCLTPA